MDWLWAALIGVGGSVVGGAVGGWFVLQAARRQSERDRQHARLDRSHDAALAIVDAVAALGEAVTTWKLKRNKDLAPLAAAFNSYSRAVAVQGIALLDPDLRNRVKNQTQLTIDFLNVAWKGGTSAQQLADVAQQHGGAPLPLTSGTSVVGCPVQRPVLQVHHDAVREPLRVLNATKPLV